MITMIVKERRRHTRLDLTAPIRVRRGDQSQIETSTRNISAGGVYFTSAEPYKVGSKFDFVMNVPQEFCREQAVELRCRSKVVRVEPPGKQEWAGVAARIVDYEFVRT